MAVSIAPKASVTAGEPEQVHAELGRCARYLYKGTLYQKGSVYVFSAESARQIFSLRDPQGLPVFIKAKPRTKLVEIPMEVQSIAVKPVGTDPELQSSSTDVSPIGKLDLGDDDPDILAKLAAADAEPELIDTAIQV